MEEATLPQERENLSANSVPPQSPKEDKGPVPLSFPSILRNPGLASRYAHLVEPTDPTSALVQPKKAWRRDDNEGKRWVRRRENGTSHHSNMPHDIPQHKKKASVMCAQRTFSALRRQPAHSHALKARPRALLHLTTHDVPRPAPTLPP